MMKQSLHLINNKAATPKRLLTLLLLLFPFLPFTVEPSVAQGDSDPFGEVDTAKYPNTMTITGYVRMNGKVLGNETVVAVYQGDELRGKKSPMSTDKYTNILMLTIYGNDSALPLHFKVFTDGHVIEVDQGLSFVTDARIGKAKDPYYIDLPAPVVTTPCTEGWATTCLPFNSEVPADVDIWYASGIGQDRLMMTRVVKNGDGLLLLPANTPVLLHFSSELMAHSAQIEWLARVADGNFTTEGSILRGTTVNTTVRAGSVLTLGHSDNNSNLGFWRFSGTVIPANHAYIADVPASVRGITLPDDISGDSFETSIQLAVDRGPSTVDRGQLISYDLLGRRVNGNSMKIRKL